MEQNVRFQVYQDIPWKISNLIEFIMAEYQP